MSFRFKILTVLVAVGVLPLALLGWLSFSANREELERSVGRAQLAIAEEAARGIERFVARGVESLRLGVETLPADQLSDEELASVLRLPYRQLDFVAALVVLDTAGRPLAAPVLERGAKEQLSEAELETFARHVPLELVLGSGTAMSAPYRGASGSARLAVGLRVGSARQRIVAAELSLGELQRRMAELGKDGAAYLSYGGAVVAHSSGSPLGDEEHALARDAASGPRTRTVRSAAGEPWLASAAPVEALQWVVVVAQPAALALRAAERVRLYTIFWSAVALVLTVGLGLLLSRSLSQPIADLSVAARALASGRYDVEVPVASGDEVGAFAETFRGMASEIRRRDDEIRKWNAELQDRVDQRTAELKAAQDQILRTRRLAALGSLGAGIAHELNNPLTGILGLAKLLRRDVPPGSPQDKLLLQLHEQARRVAKIVDDLRQFADKERQEGRRFALATPLRAALELYADQLRARHIDLQADVRDDVPEAQGDPVQLQQVVAHLVQNAMNAMPNGGTLRVGLEALDGAALKLTVTDTGKGIAAPLLERIFDPFFTTKEQPAGVGLGLSISHSIVEAHHGKLLVDSTEGRGATFTVLLPAAAAAAHLG